MPPDCVVFHGEALGRYAFPEPHPFGADRLPAFWTEFNKRGLGKRAAIETPASCGEKELLTFHTEDYVRLVREADAIGAGYLDLGDTPAFPGVWDASRAVAGTTLKAVDLILSGRFRRAFSPIAGLHHARKDRAGGFCVFNDIGLAIERLRKAGVRRIGYVDIDAHHGDGVYYEYESDAELFIGDTHEDGRYLYPGTGFAHETGSGKAKGTKLNCPLMPGAGEPEFREAFSRILELMEKAKPEFILLQCGADSLAGCPIAGLRLTPACHGYAAKALREMADQSAQGRLLAMGGGGYDTANIANAWCAVAEALV